MDNKETISHPLVLKVMRLTKPTLATPIVLTCEPSDLPRYHFENTLKADFTAPNKIETISAGEFLLVPQNFGSIYLGEIFSSFICIHNHSQGRVDDITLKVDLQTSSQRFMLLEESNLSIVTSDDTYDKIIHHEVKEIGTHILVCEVTYNKDFSFRKFFKFQVLKPLDVKTKFYVAESDEVFVEAEVQNTTMGPVCYESIQLKSSENFSITDLNGIDSDRSVFGHMNMVNKDLSRQYLYCLSPTLKASVLTNDALSVGILDIVWRANFGDRGHLQTSTLQTTRSHRENVRLSVIELPNIVKLDTPFRFTCKITNLAEYEIALLLILEESKNLVWNSKSNINLDKLQPMQSTCICLQLIPLCNGIQDIGGLKLTDVNSNYDCTFNKIAHVFVI